MSTSAIVTTYHGATNTNSSYISARAKRGTTKVCYDYNLDGPANHRAAAEALKRKFAAEDQKRNGTTPEQNPWSRPTVAGALPGKRPPHYAHTYPERNDTK